MSNVIAFKVKVKPKAIVDYGTHYKIYIPDCYRHQTIDETEALIERLEPNELPMRKRLDFMDTTNKPVEVIEYKIGTL